MALLRSLLYAAIFYPATVLWVVIGVPVSLFGRRPTLAVVLSWVDFHHWLARHVLGIRVRIEGEVPRGPLLIVVKHQSMFETLEMVRLTNLPIIVMKKELADIPLFGFLTRQYGIIAVERSAGAKALRNLVKEGREAIATGRPVIIYPEGTRVRVGETPPLDSGRLWGRGLIHQSGIVTIRIGETIPAGLPRPEIESRVHAAINLFESGAQPGA
jgi:1-acyl-sn-glycerol-3-phosphate acyltransferase